MATFEAYIDVPTDQILKLKFEQQLDDVLEENLITRLAKEIIKSNEFSIKHYELPKTLSDPDQSNTRFYIDVEVKTINC